jgi:D-ribose pyranase
MKKSGILNQPIAAVIAGMGHTDTLVVADAGLPIPAVPARIDLALTPGRPAFLDVLAAVLGDLKVERAVVARELLSASPDTYTALRELLGDIPITTVPHAEFKQQTHAAKAVIRTGEFTPYANIILVAGVVF